MVNKVRNVEITPELRAKLQRYAPIRAKNEFEYTLQAYKELPQEIRPIFKLRAIGGVGRILAQDALRGSVNGLGEVSFNRGAFTLHICKECIIGWSNYLDLSTGEEILFDPTLECLGEDTLYEIADAVLSRRNNELSEDEKLSLE